MKVRKRGISEAKRFTEQNGRELAEWCHGIYGEDPARDESDHVRPKIMLSDSTVARVGDWIVHEKLIFHRVLSDLFEALYEEIG